MKQTTVLIVGASVSGLASAASLQKQGISYIMIEKETQIASPWRNHYERLHLHTSKRLSHLPYKKFGSKIPRYPSRQDVVDYLENYQAEHNIHPAFNTEARQIKKENDSWITDTNNDSFKSKYIIIATGFYNQPKAFFCKGIETFPGTIIHSSQYKTGQAFTGQNVLVVGFGNSACEIAIDLYEQGAKPAMSVRSPVNVVPRDLLGIPIQQFSLFLSKLPPRFADALIAPLMRLKFGDITKSGLKKQKRGVFEQIKKDGIIPLLDIGTIRHIGKGHIDVYGGINYINGKTVYFNNGKEKSFDVIVAATGYETMLPNIIDNDISAFDDDKLSVAKQEYFETIGLYFCGFHTAATGLIRQIATDAKTIAKDIAEKEKSV